MSRGHYVQQDDNFHGVRVELRFTRQEYDGVDSVYQEKVVGGIVADCTIYPIDTVEGRDRLAAECVAPDMIPRR